MTQTQTTATTPSTTPSTASMPYTTPDGALRVLILSNDKGMPPGKLADAEIHFMVGPFVGLKLIGFGIWERRTGSGRNVTFPSRQYSVNGERRSFALLRPTADMQASERARDLILQAYAAWEAGEAGEPNAAQLQDAQAGSGFIPHQPAQPSRATTDAAAPPKTDSQGDLAL